MRKATLGRWGLMGSVAALGLLGANGAQAYETKFGEFEIVFDTTVSAGVSMRAADRNTDFLPEVNGGTNADGRAPYFYSPVTYATGTFNTLSDPTGASTTDNRPLSTATLAGATNRAGSINGDDGRLNYDSGDLTGATLKASHDLQVKWRNFTLFGRWFEFYDVVQDNKDVGDRSSYSDEVQGTVGRDAKLLDLFISGNFDLFGENLNVRVGKQVISWGEGTFILNGINVVNPIDVTAFRRPGAEIKEGLIPVNSIFASVSLPIEGMSMSGFYMLDFEPFEIDAAGTPFSNTDILDASNLDPRGSINSFLSGGRYSGTFRRNCNEVDNPLTASFTSGAFRIASAVGGAVLTNYRNTVHARCNNAAGTVAAAGDFTHYTQAIGRGEGELVKNGFHNGLAGGFDARDADESIVTRLGNNEAEASDQYGLRLNYYSDDIGAEFGFYYMNYHSRLPFISFRANSPRVTISTTSPTSSATGRAPLPVGCLFNATTNPAVLLLGQSIAPGTPTTEGFLLTGDDRAFYTGSGTLASQTAERDLFRNTRIADPNNYEGAMAAIAQAIAAGNPNPLISGIAASLTLDATASGTGQADLNNLSRINCLLAAVSSGSPGIPGVPPVMYDGSEILGAVNDMSIFLDYPEDIQMFGFSFNTTIWGWGVQGEMSYRPDAPFQIDTDELTIASAFTQCASFALGSSGASFQLLQTSKQYNCPYNDDLTQTAAQKAAAGLRPGEQVLPGYFFNEMFTAQVGTTATFTPSEWWMEALGADLGVFVTEFGMVHVPDVEKTYINDLAGGPTTARTQYQNTGCQGSDLPLGGFVELSAAPSRACRPTSTSAGYVLLGRVSYNNAFNTGYVLSPTVTFSHDFYGTTPAPYSNYLQDRMSASLSLGAELNNNFRMNLGYTNFWGGHLNNKAQDQDFVSFSAQYSF